jgi:hypothetical protein
MPAELSEWDGQAAWAHAYAQGQERILERLRQRVADMGQPAARDRAASDPVPGGLLGIQAAEAYAPPRLGAHA